MRACARVSVCVCVVRNVCPEASEVSLTEDESGRAG